MREYHLAAGFGTLLIAAALVAVSVLGHLGPAQAAGPNLADMEAIEASLAYKKTTKSKQPQKKFRAPVPEEKPQGVSRDENKPVEPTKPDEPKPKADEDFEKLYDKFKRDDDEDLPVGKPTEEVGDFDGSDFGFAEENKGDPYFQKLIADLRSDWSYPEILTAAGVPVGCVRLAADGTVVEVNFKEKSGDLALDDSAERALASLKKKRNQAPVPVPTHLLRAATTRWICFSFKV